MATYLSNSLDQKTNDRALARINGDTVPKTDFSGFVPVPQSLDQLVSAGAEEIIKKFIFEPMAAKVAERVGDREQMLAEVMALVFAKQAKDQKES